MNKNYRMAKFININGKYVPYTNDTDLIKLQSEEIERLNNIINELEKDLLDSIEYWENQEKLWIEEGFMKFGGEANNKIIFKGVLKTLQELKEGK